MVSRPAPILKENRISNIHGRQDQIYSVYRSGDGWNVKDRWGHSSDWDGFKGIETKEEAVEMAKERARKDRPAMVEVHDETEETFKYPLRKKDIPEEAMGKDITDEERKRKRKELLRLEYDFETNKTYDPKETSP